MESRVECLMQCCTQKMGFPGGSDSKESVCNAGDLGLIPWLGRSSGEGSGNPLQYSCLENPMDRGAWQATVHSVAKSWTQFSNRMFQFGSIPYLFLSVQFSSVAQSCPTLCNPMNCSTPGLLVHHQLPEVTQTHVH